MSLLTRTRPRASREETSAELAVAAPGRLAPDTTLAHELALGDLDLREAPRIYCGRTLDELIPRIVAELGSDAVVLRHERGLTGGFAGFFRRPFVEIEAEAGAPRFDRYDEDDGGAALPDAYDEDAGRPLAVNGHGAAAAHAHAETFAAPSMPRDPFSEELASAEAAAPVVIESLHVHDLPPHVAPPAEPAPEARYDEGQYELPALAPLPDGPAGTAPLAVSSGPERDALERALTEAGVGAQLVRELLDAAAAHVLPLVAGAPSLEAAVRRALARLIPVCPPLPAGGVTVAFVGPGGSGKSACCAALLDAYHRRSTLPAACATLAGELDVVFAPHLPGPIPIDDPLAEQALRRARAEGLLILDTPPLSPADDRAIAALARALERVAPDRVVLALPATLGTKPAARLLEAYRPLHPAALAVTHADETDQLGVAVEIAHALAVAPAYLLEGGTAGLSLTEVEPGELAARLLARR